MFHYLIGVVGPENLAHPLSMLLRIVTELFYVHEFFQEVVRFHGTHDLKLGLRSAADASRSDFRIAYHYRLCARGIHVVILVQSVRARLLVECGPPMAGPHRPGDGSLYRVGLLGGAKHPGDQPAHVRPRRVRAARLGQNANEKTPPSAGPRK